MTFVLRRSLGLPPGECGKATFRTSSIVLGHPEKWNPESAAPVSVVVTYTALRTALRDTVHSSSGPGPAQGAVDALGAGSDAARGDSGPCRVGTLRSPAVGDARQWTKNLSRRMEGKRQVHKEEFRV